MDFETDHLTLRRFEEDDLEALWPIRSDRDAITRAWHRGCTNHTEEIRVKLDVHYQRGFGNQNRAFLTPVMSPEDYLAQRGSVRDADWAPAAPRALPNGCRLRPCRYPARTIPCASTSHADRGRRSRRRGRGGRHRA